MNAPIKVSADVSVCNISHPGPCFTLECLVLAAAVLAGAVELNQFIDGGWSRNTVSHLIY